MGNKATCCGSGGSPRGAAASGNGRGKDYALNGSQWAGGNNQRTDVSTVEPSVDADWRLERPWADPQRRHVAHARGGGGHAQQQQAQMTRDDTSFNLQHISDREFVDISLDPSTHPTAKPTFMERSQSDMRIRENRRSFYVLDGNWTAQELRPMRKSNSCSTIYVDDSTISQPNLKNTIKCISLAIYYHVANRRNRGCEQSVDIFDENSFPISRSRSGSSVSSSVDPDHRTIYRFVRTLFHAAQLTAECAIITLVYIERLLNYAEMELYGANWRRVVLGAIMMASKVWDDQAVWNVDYCQILPDASVEDMNELERQFLELLEFNINVPSSVYAKYYFDLRTLALANDLQLPLQPLYKERAQRLEALSRDREYRLLDEARRRAERKWSSAERLAATARAPVVIS